MPTTNKLGFRRYRIIHYAVRSLVLGLLSFALSSCAFVERQLYQENSASQGNAIQLSHPTDNPLILVYRTQESLFGNAKQAPNLKLDQKTLGPLHQDTYYQLQVRPGAHQISLHETNEAAALLAEFKLVTEFGKLYYIQINEVSGAFVFKEKTSTQAEKTVYRLKHMKPAIDSDT